MAHSHHHFYEIFINFQYDLFCLMHTPPCRVKTGRVCARRRRLLGAAANFRDLPRRRRRRSIHPRVRVQSARVRESARGTLRVSELPHHHHQVPRSLVYGTHAQQRRRARLPCASRVLRGSFTNLLGIDAMDVNEGASSKPHAPTMATLAFGSTLQSYRRS